MQKQYQFSSEQLETQIPHLQEKGITEFSLHDEKIAVNKKRIIQLIDLFAEYAPELYVSFLIDASVVDKELVSAAEKIFCSFDIPLKASEKGGKLLFDKKFYGNKARLLNDSGLVFGFQLTYADVPGDSLKNFMERMDFAVQQYPNHLDFPQTENADLAATAKVSGLFSAQDIRYARDLSFACRSFYSAGRAVPWMLSVLKPLKIYPSRFFADFSEWQRCNNCDFKSGFNPEAADHKEIDRSRGADGSQPFSAERTADNRRVHKAVKLLELYECLNSMKHKEIEKMQLLFLEQKCEEKNCSDLFPLVQDIVKINGAMSRLAGEGKEEVIKTSYNPEDLLGPESMDLVSFSENVCMEECSVKIFAGEYGPDFAIL